MLRLEQELQNADARIRELEAERDAALAELAKQTDLAREAELKWGNLKDRLRRVEQEQNVEAIKSERNAALARVADLKYFLDKANKLLEQAEAERDKEIQRASDTGAELSQQWANRAKAERERDAARAEAVTLRLALEQILDWFTTENVGMFEAVYGELDETDVIDHAKKCLSDESIVFRHLDRDRKRDEALAYYADVANYIPTLSQVGLIGKSKVALDGGQRARESLKEE